MSKTAILVDGGYYRRLVKDDWEKYSPEESADALVGYCRRHLKEGSIDHELYRIFYYDCPPLNKQVYEPFSGKTYDLGKTEEFSRMTSFLSCLKKKRKVALRMGKLSGYGINYTLTYDSVKKICNGSLTKDDLNQTHFQLNTLQKGVDMKIGIDIASLAYKKQVDQVVLIAGDSDFVPVLKLARREGLDVILEPMGRRMSEEGDLFEHIDGLRSCGSPYHKKQQKEEFF